jgi:archaellin
MFGADTALVFDALQMVAVTAVVTGGAVYAAMRVRSKSKSRQAVDQVANSSLENRVRVLERIATDRSIDLAEEIEALRGPEPTATNQLKESTQ